MIRCTTACPVRGSVQVSTTFGLPCRSLCSMTTMTRLAPCTRSIAPPMPLTILPAPSSWPGRRRERPAWLPPPLCRCGRHGSCRRTATNRRTPFRVGRMDRSREEHPQRSHTIHELHPAGQRHRSCQPAPGQPPQTPQGIHRVFSVTRGGVTSMLRPHRMCWRRRSGCRWRNWRSGPKTDGPLGPGRLHPPVQFRRWGPPSRSPRPRG
jgi:hypothetical protein